MPIIRIESDYSELEREFLRLEALPFGAKAELDTALMFGATQASALVHVDTGKLKASQKVSSRVTKNTWIGKFSFGDRAKGVDYAIYERARGGHHDFLSGVHLLKPVFVEAIKRALRKKR